MSWQTTCAKCGGTIEAGDRFCTQCGRPVTSAPRKPPAAPPPAVPPPLPPSSVPPPLPPTARPAPRLGALAAIAALLILVCLIALVIVLLKRPNQRSASEPASATPIKQVTATPSLSPSIHPSVPSYPTAPPLGPTTSRPPVSSGPTPARHGAQLFMSSFNSAAPITRPLFGRNMMWVRHVNGEAELTGLTKGILPSMFDRFFLDDFIIDCEMRAGTATAGSAYGLLFRAADVQNGAINSYYALLLDPTANTVGLSCLQHGNWVYNQRQRMPAALSLRVGTPQITLEAIGSRFRVFVDRQFAAEFNDGTLREGRIGLCVLDRVTAYFDNFYIYMTP